MIKTIIIAAFTALFGYFLGIYKERSNIKWKEQRETLKKFYKVISELHFEFTNNNLDKLNDFINNDYASMSRFHKNLFKAMVSDFVDILKPPNDEEKFENCDCTSGNVCAKVNLKEKKLKQIIFQCKELIEKDLE